MCIDIHIEVDMDMETDTPSLPGSSLGHQDSDELSLGVSERSERSERRRRRRQEILERSVIHTWIK